MTAFFFTEFKLRHMEMWTSYEETLTFTTLPGSDLVQFYAIKSASLAFDLEAETSVVNITAARAGAKVTALDLKPKSLEQAHKNTDITSINEINWHEGDAENLSFPDEYFDLSNSQFGHKLTPHLNAFDSEMQRVLVQHVPFAFSTWPPGYFTSQMFNFMGCQAAPGPVEFSPQS